MRPKHRQQDLPESMTKPRITRTAQRELVFEQPVASRPIQRHPRTSKQHRHEHSPAISGAVAQVSTIGRRHAGRQLLAKRPTAALR